MKTTSQVLADFSQLSVKVWVEGDVLRYQAPKGTLTPELLSQLRERKPEIIELLQQNLHRDDRAIVATPRTQASTLSFSQQRLWFLNELEGENATYNISLALRLEGNLNREALNKALETIIDRHETLATSFSSENGVPIQIVTPNLKFDLPIVNLASLPDREREDRAIVLAQEEAKQPFDLSIAPLFRAKLLKLTQTSQILLLTIHHAIADGWSMGIFRNELSILYRDFIEGRSPSLPPLPIQYIDFSVWQRNWLQGEILAEQVNYWKTQLANIPPVLNLPTDKPRPAIQTFTGNQHKIQLSTEIGQQLKQLSQQSGATLFMTLLTVFGILLSRYSQQEDIVVGSPIANRNRQEIESLIGFFANTLALRIDLQNNPSFRELLARVKGVCLDAYNHQDLPIEKLVEELQPERSLSYHPIFQTAFILQNTPSRSIDLTNLKITPFKVDTQTSKFDLTLSLTETPAGLAGFWEYNTDLFNNKTIERMSSHFEVLLAAIVINPDRSICQLPLLTSPERQQLLIDWNQTAVAYPHDRCIHQLFEAQAARTPSAIAVVFEGRELTYQELDRQANQLAHYLQSLGANPEISIGICVDRSCDLLVGLLGILKAGAGYVPLDPAYPQERLAFMLQDSQIDILLTQSHLLTALPAHSAQVICLDSNWDITMPPQTVVESSIISNNLIYTIYTSGSTGKPKGVRVTHRNVVNFLTGMQQHLQLTDRDSLLSVTSLSFDILGLEIFLPLTLGAKVILCSREVTTDGFQLLAQLDRSAPTVMQATPATWLMLIAAGWTKSTHLKILCGGEALSQDLANRLCNISPEVWNLYGPTETTIWSTIERVRAQASLITIGRPIANTQIYILDKYYQPVPIGVRGELYIAGDGVARGYLDRDSLTAERFIQNPFSTDDRSRLYKTGDLARYQSDGKIEYLGRIDNQIKIRGFRIELGEIETVLKQHPAIHQSAIAITTDDAGENRLVAYIIFQPTQTLSIEQLRRFLKQELPDYMVPSVFMFLDTLPLTPNGKIDRRALPIPDLTSSISNYSTPRNPTEQWLVQIWSEVLKLERVGIYDNFFDLGGHSLAAVAMIAKINHSSDEKIPLVTLFHHQTIAELATVVEPAADCQTNQLPAWQSPIQIKQGRATKAPIFLLHDVSGSVLFYRQLANHLQSDRAVYVIQPQGLDGQKAPIDCVSEMATRYIAEIRQVQPIGPYYLGGYSFGAVVAFEIARQLEAQGQEIKLLAIVDTQAPVSVEPNLLQVDVRAQELPTNFSRLIKLCSLSGQQRKDYIRYGFRNQCTFGKLRTPYRFYLRYIKKSNLELGALDVYWTNTQAYKNYAAKSIYSGKVALFCSDRLLLNSENNPHLNWDKIATGGADVYPISGSNHATIIQEPFVRILAEKLMLAFDD